MNVARDVENLSLVPQSLGADLDWEASVPIIPEGAVVDITDDPFNQSGFYGDIYLGYHSNMALRVVLKRPRNLSEKHIRRFFREGHTWTKLQQLQHPNILPFFGAMWFQSRFHLVSPYVTNGSLDEYLNRLPDANRIELLRQAAGAVAHMHDLGIIHGDIKANNILITADNRVLLCDFGLAQITELQPVDNAYSGVYGNPRWASPELALEGERSFMSDVWAFGMTIYQVLSGKVPFFHLRGDFAPTARILKGERPEKIPSHSSTGFSYAPVWDVAEGCWQHEATDRLDMKEIAHRLRMTARTVSRILRSSTGVDNFDDDSNARKPGQSDEDTFFAMSECVEMGPVMVGDHPEHGLVVLKRFRRIPLRRPNGHPRPDFQSELWACLRHPHILPFLGICVLGPQLNPFMMSEYMEQGTIIEYLKSHTEADLSKMILQLASAIAYLHDELIVHGGVQGDNILVSGGGRVLLAGFSSATVIGGLLPGPDFRRIPSFRWSSPEYIRTGIQTSASDVFSFGITVNEILTGKRPFDNIDQEDQLKAMICDGWRPEQSHESRHDFLTELANTCWKAAIIRPTMGAIMTDLRNPRVMLVSRRPGDLVGQIHDVRCLALSPDGTLLASGSDNGIARIWEMTSGELKASVEGLHGAIDDITFSPDGTNLALSSSDGTVRLWTALGNALVSLASSLTSTKKIVYSSNGSRLALATEPPFKSQLLFKFHPLLNFDSELWIWDVTTGSLLNSVKDIPMISGLAFSPDGSILAVSTSVGVQVWEISETSATCRIECLSRDDWWCSSRLVVFSPDGALLAIYFGEADGMPSYAIIQLWHTTSWEPATSILTEHRIRSIDTLVFSETFSPNALCLVALTNDGKLLSWDVSSGREEMALDTTPQTSRSVLSQDGSKLAVETAYDIVEVWDTKSRKTLRKVGVKRAEGVVLDRPPKKFAMSSDGSRLASIVGKGLVRTWSIDSEGDGD